MVVYVAFNYSKNIVGIYYTPSPAHELADKENGYVETWPVL